MNRNKLLLILAVVIIVGVIVVVAVAIPRLRPPTFHGMVLQTSNGPASDFMLTAHTGEEVSLSDFRGKHVILYFGYTFCPDVCPLTLADLGQAVRLLGEKGEDVQVLMVSVDPERDTAERLAQYAPAFHPSFVGLTGSPEDIALAATPFGIYYEKREVEGASGYLMDHTASITLLDDKGRVRLIWPFGTSAEFIAEDLDYFVR